MHTPGWVRGPMAVLAVAAGNTAKGRDGSGDPDGDGTGDSPEGTPGGASRAPHRTRIALLATGIAGVLAVAGTVASTLGAARPAGRTTPLSATTSASPSASPTATPAGPLKVLSVTEGGRVRGTNGADPIRVRLSAALAATSPLPTVSPAVPGSWKRAGTTLDFTPRHPFQPGSAVQVHAAAGRRGLVSVSGGLLANPVTARLHTAGWPALRLQELLAQLGYLPRSFVPADPATALPSSYYGELATVYAPPAGHFTWNKGYPRILARFWGGPSSLIMQGAIRAFQHDHGAVMTGQMTPARWVDLLRAAAHRRVNPHGYTYALASKASPETLTVWHNGRVILHSLANTGIAAAPTADGTYPVYLRYYFQVMKGTNPDGSKYADPVYYIAYFHGGDAVHYFSRASYGWPQSLGCVELPWNAAKKVWPYLSYGTLVTVRG